MVDPIFFENKCPKYHKTPEEIHKLFPTMKKLKGFPPLTVYIKCSCGYTWNIESSS